MTKIQAISVLTRVLVSVVILSIVSAQPAKPNGVDKDSLRPMMLRRSGRGCSRVKIRTISGQCTSRKEASYGQARFATYSYAGDVSAETPTGAGRRSAREISNIVFNQEGNTKNSRGLNELFVFFGQFVDHNFAGIVDSDKEEDEFDIPVPDSDPELDVKVLHFRRSVRSRAPDGKIRAMNILSSAVDLDAVYGANDERSAALKEKDEDGFFTGKLKTSRDNLLPLNTGGFFNSPDTSADFFFAGDHRPNEHPALTTMHTVWLREHNRLAEMVLERLPSLPPGDVYEFARYMNVAQFQKIVFEQFYPALIGADLPRYTGHNPRVDLTVSDIFSTAGFRFGHTMIGVMLPRRGPSGPLEPVPLASTFFKRASEFNSVENDNIIRGIANTRAQEVDTQIVDTLRNQLFEFVPEEEGFDLIALNLQRGRDHALPTFNEIRSLFGLPKLTSFSDISSDPEVAANLAEAYDGDIDEVEAFPGLMAEDHMRGSGVGPTMAALWRAEFTRLRDGDQFFFRNTAKRPPQLRRDFSDFFEEIDSPMPNLFKDIIVRNTNITMEQLPSGNVFFS